MRESAVVLALMALVLAWPVPPRLARQEWPTAAPGTALVLWQAIGLAGGLSAVGALTLFGLEPLGDDLYAAAEHWLQGTAHDQLGPLEVVALLAAGALSAWLFGRLVLYTVRTLLARRRHRRLLDLLAAPEPALGGAQVLDHAVATAYCLPGIRSRVVVSQGTLAALDGEELAAVLAHERAHATQRHDLVVLPFLALADTFPRLPAVRVARQEVALLVEMLADDAARATSGAEALASALVRVRSAAPGGALAAGAGVEDSSATQRLRRLLDPPPPASRTVRTTAYASAGLLVLAPTAVLLALPLVS